MMEDLFEEFNPKFATDDLSLTCQNGECEQFFHPNLQTNNFRKVELSDRCVYVSFSTFRCPVCATTYSGVTLSAGMYQGLANHIMFLEKPKMLKIGLSLVAS